MIDEAFMDRANPALARLLEIAADCRAEFHVEEDETERRELARETVEALLDAVSEMAGDDIITAAFPKPGIEESRPAHLVALKDRLWVVSALLRLHDKPTDQHSLYAARTEIDYMLRGDAPRLFAPVMKVGKFSNSNKIAEHWLRAWEWVEFLSLNSGTKGECKQAVADAYGIERDRLEKWKPQAREYLGNEVDRRLRRVKDRRAIRFRFKSEQEGRDALLADAKAFKAEERYDGDRLEDQHRQIPRE